MTLSSTASRIRYEGDGATSSFPVPFKFFDKAHVRVTLRDAADQETLWNEGTQYGLTGAGNDSGGTLTVVTAPQDFRPKAGESLVIALVVPFTQEKSFPLGGAFPSTQVEEGFDLAVQRDAQLSEFDRRVMSVPASDTQVGKLELAIDSQRAGKYLGFDATGKPSFLAGTAEAADLSDKTVLPTGAGEARSLADLFGLGALTAENVKLHGAKGDTVELADGSVTDGSAVLSSASVAFQAADIGKAVWVEAAATTGKAISDAVNGPIDAAWQYDASADSFVDLTEELNDAAAGDVEPFPATEEVGDLFYIGHIQAFDRVSIEIGTPGVGGTLAWEYWDGTAWQALTVTDGTGGFTAAAGSHDLTFTPPVDWATTQLNLPINGRRLFYIRARLTALYTTNPVLDRATLDGGRIRLTATGHQVEPLQTVSIKGVVGTTEANGTFQVERIDNDTLDLIGPSFSNAYVSGGTVHGRLETTIASVSGGDATLNAAAGASVAGTAAWAYGTDDTAAFQAAADTGKAVVVPDGHYLVSQIRIETDGQKLVGMGGRMVALPKSLHGISGQGLVQVEADFVEVTGLYLDNPTEQQSKAASWPSALRYGIAVRGRKAKIHHNTVRRFQHGISVNFGSNQVSGEEYGESIIDGNIVWDCLGAGSGTAQAEGIQGESSGDGINSWGAAVIITNNIVHVKEGQDARIGIHCERLADRYDPDDPGALYPDTGCVISNNIILAHGMDARNGRFRRSIVTEGVQEVTISGNKIYGGGWWAIAAAMAGDSNQGPFGNISITGNTILWTRPDVDKAGQGFTPQRAAIAIFSNSSVEERGIINTAIADNCIEIQGSCGAGIATIAFVTSGKQRNVTVSGNTIHSTGKLGDFILGFTGVEEMVIKGNCFKGIALRDGIRMQAGITRGVISGNVIQLEKSSGHGIFAGGFSNEHCVIEGNIITGAGQDGIGYFNVGNGLIINGNIIRETGGDGVDGFGSTPAILSNNIFEEIGGAYTQHWPATATKLDVNNIKN